MSAIEVRDLCKTFRVYAKPADRLKEALLGRPRHQAFQPLRDISFKVPQAGITGIIGDNGAGKSTLLKILAGTLTPTCGEVTRRGRVAALLELGAGFHPEFTGRQNIYLNAALLGLSDEEIKEREAGIIEFSELAEFIDRPVKTYSSGMYVRLAFSIATSVDPDILIIDEALSVGDAHFQKKSLERMMRFKEAGKTILFCSHNMYHIQELCHQVLWLERGCLRHYGTTSEVVSAYLAYLEQREREIGKEQIPQPAPGGDAPPEVSIDKLKLTGEDGLPLQKFTQFESVNVELVTRPARVPGLRGHVGILMQRPDEQVIFVATTRDSGLGLLDFTEARQIHLNIPRLPLGSGSYFVRAIVADEHALRVLDEKRTEILWTYSEHPDYGLLWLPHEWQV